MELIKVKEILDKKSPTFCLAKWTQVTLHLHNGQSHSCHHPTPHKIDATEIESAPDKIHNTSHKKYTRKQMLEGKRPSECQYCWTIEDVADDLNDNEVFSDRIIKSSDFWSKELLENLKSIDESTYILPTYVEVSFSNQCNLKCSYCSPVYSSRWMDEIKKYGPYNTSYPQGDLNMIKGNGELPIHHSERNPYVEAFWKWWPDLVKGLKVFRLTGGEPLINKETFRLLENLLANPQPELRLAINTNGSIPEDKVTLFLTLCDKLVKRSAVESVEVYTTLDAYSEHAEYSRFGLNFNLWEKNIKRILDHGSCSKVIIMCTANIFSVPKYDEYLKYILKLKRLYNSNSYPERVILDTAILRYPHHLNAKILSKDCIYSVERGIEFMIHNKVNSTLSGFTDSEINKVERFIKYLKCTEPESIDINITHARKDFRVFVDEHDKRRNTDFKATFSELVEFYHSCKPKNVEEMELI